MKIIIAFIAGVIFALIIFFFIGKFSVGRETVHGRHGYDSIRVFNYYDNQKNVTCWYFKSGFAGGLSCIPDEERS